MEINDRLKRMMFKKLSNDLSHVEIIRYDGSIWLIDRDKKYWYLELTKCKHLSWRFGFFERFFQAFSLDRDDYVPIMRDWVEQVLKRKVSTSASRHLNGTEKVDQVLNSK
jgi:hypothetical protein